MKPERSPLPAPEFWQSFRQRASEVGRDEPVALAWAPPIMWRWAAVAACVAIMLGGMVFYRPSRGLDDGLMAANEVKSLEVAVAHSGYMVLNDHAGRGTIIWVAGLEDNSD